MVRRVRGLACVSTATAESTSATIIIDPHEPIEHHDPHGPHEHTATIDPHEPIEHHEPITTPTTTIAPHESAAASETVSCFR